MDVRLPLAVVPSIRISNCLICSSGLFSVGNSVMYWIILKTVSFLQRCREQRILTLSHKKVRLNIVVNLKATITITHCSPVANCEMVWCDGRPVCKT